MPYDVPSPRGACGIFPTWIATASSPSLPVLVFFGLMAASLGGLLLLPPITQDQSYHQFADQRTILGIPNFWNVVSNLPFLAVGAAGLRRFRDDPATVVFFLGVFLTGIGSSYYHWNPNDDTLFWDRLPMTLAFAAILCARRRGTRERKGRGHSAVAGARNRLVQLVVVALDRRSAALLLGAVLSRSCSGIAVSGCTPPKYTGTSYWIAAGALYALAKVFEFTDEAIYSANGLLSGHTLKHLAAAAACFAILRYFQTRRPILGEHRGAPSE